MGRHDLGELGLAEEELPFWSVPSSYRDSEAAHSWMPASCCSMNVRRGWAAEEWDCECGRASGNRGLLAELLDGLDLHHRGLGPEAGSEGTTRPGTVEVRDI